MVRRKYQSLIDLEHTEDIADITDIAGRIVAGVQVLAGALLAWVDDDLTPVFWNSAAGCRTTPLRNVISRYDEL